MNLLFPVSPEVCVAVREPPRASGGGVGVDTLRTPKKVQELGVPGHSVVNPPKYNDEIQQCRMPSEGGAYLAPR